MNDLSAKIEAILFFRGEPLSRKRLAEILKVGEQNINEGITALKASLAGRGIAILEKDNDITLGTAPELSDLIERLQKEELNRELSKASLETLSIILYRNGANRADIDYIRGVNSNFILRALSVRGLVERIQDPEDNRRFIYRPTFDLLSFMGIKSVEELPEWAEVRNSIASAIQNKDDAQS